MKLFLKIVFFILTILTTVGDYVQNIRYLAMGHEYVHAALNNMGYFKGSDTNLQEYHAYRWTAAQAKGFGLNTDDILKHVRHYKGLITIEQRYFNFFNKSGLGIIFNKPNWYLLE